MTANPPEFTLLPETRAVAPRIVEVRRDLHQHPELGFQERRTAKLVAERMGQWGYEVREGVGETGVVGHLKGGKPGRTLMIRADMDALPMPEERDVPYRSKVPDVMHACGHDGHVAMALGAAEILSSMRDRLAGNVRFCFQPAEEGLGGAERMIAEGVLKDVDAAVGIHVWNDLDVGLLGVGRGPMLAAEDSFTITVEGSGGHGAYPEETIDPVVVASHIVVALQTVVSRNVSPLDPAVVTVGTINAGYAVNIIPRTATLTGTLRSYDDGVRELLVKRVHEVAQGVAATFGARATFDHHAGYPATVNDADLADFVAEVGRETFGDSGVIVPRASMGAEDMSYYLRQVPGAFVFLGSRNTELGLDAPHHSSQFDFDEAALPAGTDLFVRVALRYLRP